MQGIIRWMSGMMVVALVATGCGLMRESGQETSQDEDLVTIGFLVDNLVIERWQRDQEIFQSTAEDLGAEVLVYNANEDNATQNQQLLALVDKEVDVIVVIPYNKSGLKDSIQKAQAEGIKVIAYDRLVTGVDLDAYISFDNVKVGRLIGQAMLDKVPSGNYVIINGSPNDHNSGMFHKGYMGVLNPAIAQGKIKIVGQEWAEDWREGYAYNLVDRVLSQDITIDAIIGANDRLAEAAINALKERGLGGQVIVAGHDADISACQRIVEGTQYMTVYKPIGQLASQAVQLAMDLANNQEISYEETIHNGWTEVPYIKLDVLPVFDYNMEATVIQDGFHQRSDVYRNK